MKDNSNMSKPAMCTRGKGCIFLICLCAVHLVVVLIYVLRIHDRISFSAEFYILNSSNRGFQDADADTSQEYEENDTGSLVLKSIEHAGRVWCPRVPPELEGHITVFFRKNPPTFELVQKMNPSVQEGGHWWPKDCTARQKVAIIIPYRNRESHLKYWLYYLHPILQRQKLDYHVYIINQAGDTTFNRGKLMNVGFVEVQKQDKYDCFVFSDVDIIPINDHNFYKCYSQPRHLAAYLDIFGYEMEHKKMFGGVTALTKKQFTTINGFPNTYWGWGGEDDDISNRIFLSNMTISRPDYNTGLGRMIRHSGDKNNEKNPDRFHKIKQTNVTMDYDGLNTLEYGVLSIEKAQLYTNITVDVGIPPPSNVTLAPTTESDQEEELQSSQSEGLTGNLVHHSPADSN